MLRKKILKWHRQLKGEKTLKLKEASEGTHLNPFLIIIKEEFCVVFQEFPHLWKEHNLDKECEIFNQSIRSSFFMKKFLRALKIYMQCILPSERSQSERTTYCMIPPL